MKADALKGSITSALLCAIVSACGNKTPAPKLAAPQVSPVDHSMLQDLSLLARDAAWSPEELQDIGSQINNGKLTVPRYIDSLLADERFANRVAPRLMTREIGASVPIGADSSVLWFVLEDAAKPGEPPLYYKGSSCKEDEAVSVRPWWDMATEVRVCPSAYRQETWRSPRNVGDLPVVCYSTFGLGSPKCGCGPNLMRCYRDWEHHAEMGESLTNEVRGTIAHVVREDLPLSSVFTSNHSFRDRNAEFYFRHLAWEANHSNDIESSLKELQSWPAEGKWAARPELAPGQHSGIITSPRVMYKASDRRQRMAYFFDLLWCMGADSTGATTDAILALDNRSNQFVQEAWKELAERDLCTNCHARMDYGWQFFLGYPDGRVTAHFVSKLQAAGATSPMYGRDIRDLRGEAEKSPRGFASLAIQQPEYFSCMAKDFTSYVFGTELPSEVQAALEKDYTNNPKMTATDLMRRALLAYVDHRQRKAREPAASAFETSAAQKGAATVVVTNELGELLEEHCGDCHGEAEKIPDFARKTLPRQLAFKMLDSVSHGSMPKGQLLDPAQRQALLRALVEVMWSAEGERQVAFDFHLDHLQGVPVHSIPSSIEQIHRSAGADPKHSWLTIEEQIPADLPSLTPSFAAITSIEAIAACKAAGKGGKKLAACLRSALDMSVLAK